MKLKDRIRIQGGWKRERIFLDFIETVWMTFLPLAAGMLFGFTHKLPWLLLGMLPLVFKFIYKREGDDTIYLR